MLGVRVKRNGKRVCVAGLEPPGVVSAIVTIVRRENEPDGLNLTVGGYFRDKGEGVFMRWQNVALAPGDEVLIKIANVKKVDAATAERDEPNALEKRIEAYRRRRNKRLHE